MPTSEPVSPVQVAVIGAGHVGLVTAVGFTHHGHAVQIGEQDADRVALLRSGGIPFHEPGLDRLVTEGIEAGLLTFHASNAEAAAGATSVFVAVPTPAGPAGEADLSAVEAAIRSIAGVTADSTAIVVKSSVPPGSWRSILAWMDDAGCAGDLVVNPEFLQEGRAVARVLEPDRVVIGTHSEAAGDLVARLHEPMGAPVVRTDPATAELIKYAANAFLGMRVAFANTIADLCERVGADVADVVRGIGLDPRIGTRFMQPGPGYGGSCLPKDLPALVAAGRDHGLDLEILRSVIEANESRAAQVVEKLIDLLGSPGGRRVALWGLAFKAGTDDVAASPALKIARLLVEAGAEVRAYDPRARADLDGVVQVGSALAALEGADALLIATEWPEFADIDPGDVAAVMDGRVVVDARNVMDKAAALAAGLEYRGMGR